MSDKEQENSLFSNEDTLVRRAWIESALTGVRSHLQAHTGDPLLISQGFDAAADSNFEPAAVKAETNAASQPAVSDKPRLYVAWSSGARRSGT